MGEWHHRAAVLWCLFRTLSVVSCCIMLVSNACPVVCYRNAEGIWPITLQFHRDSFFCLFFSSLRFWSFLLHFWNQPKMRAIHGSGKFLCQSFVLSNICWTSTSTSQFQIVAYPRFALVLITKVSNINHTGVEVQQTKKTLSAKCNRVRTVCHRSCASTTRFKLSTPHRPIIADLLK